MQQSNSKAGLYAKMAAVMGELNNIPKTGTNTHFNYKFVTADAVADKVRELLAEKGIAFFASIVGRELMEVRKGSEKTDPKTGEVTRLVTTSARWVVNFEFTFADSESGAAHISTWTAEAASDDDKGINKCATAAEKYFLLKTFIVSSADEPDADADGKGKRQQSPAHWVKQNGAGQRFNARMKELALLPSDVLAQLEPDRALARLSDTTLNEAAAFARLDELAEAAETPLQAPPTPQGTTPAQTAQNAPAGNVVAQQGAADPNGAASQNIPPTSAGQQNGGASHDADADGFRRYLVHEIVVNEMPNGGRQYVAKSEIGDNIVTFGGEAFQDAGFDTSKWSANGRPNKVDPAAIIEAKFDGKRWLIKSVEVAF